MATRRVITARKTTLSELENDDFDVAFWAAVPPEERFAETWRLSEELYRLTGRSTEDSREPRLSRSVARVIRR